MHAILKVEFDHAKYTCLIVYMHRAVKEYVAWSKLLVK